MWVFRYFRFVRLWRDGQRLSTKTVLLLPIIVPVLIVQVALIGFVLAVMFFIAVSASSAFDLIGRAVEAARSHDQIDEPFLTVKGGGFRQAGYEQEGSLIRPGGSLSSDDMRHRLDELRSTDPGGPGRRSLN